MLLVTELVLLLFLLLTSILSLGILTEVISMTVISKIVIRVIYIFRINSNIIVIIVGKSLKQESLYVGELFIELLLFLLQ